MDFGRGTSDPFHGLCESRCHSVLVAGVPRACRLAAVHQWWGLVTNDRPAPRWPHPRYRCNGCHRSSGWPSPALVSLTDSTFPDDGLALPGNQTFTLDYQADSAGWILVTRSAQRSFGRAWRPTTSRKPPAPLKSSGLAV